MSRRIEKYLAASRNRAFWEDPEIHIPPQPGEVKALIAELRLRHRRMRPRLVGSVAVAFHLRHVEIAKLRPTVDVDLFVHVDPGPPPFGWKRDDTCLAFPCFRSPSGGYCDLLVADHEYANGNKNPTRVRVSGDSRWELPVADPIDLFLMKVSTDRLHDLVSAVELARLFNGIPDEVKRMKHKLTQIQLDNLHDVELWLARWPSPQQ